ncbi:MAG TPA: DUF2293 domain-containing protein [Tepidisphaeraceae bacterium]|jgi:hypothetical protein|nr:DUF2293 domain-containing protein [Tepidisphaeraceae bacterium]
MPEPLIFSPGPTAGTLRSAAGQILTPPADWVLVPPGDPALTRRLKLAGPTWLVQEKVGRKLFSKGLYAPEAIVAQIRVDLATERSDPAYARKQANAAQRRDRDQAEYVHSFEAAVFSYLAFHPAHTDLARHLAAAIAVHATPVGSGTVARTERIPIQDRAEAATIAWLRHQTTTYDQMSVPRIKGKRREIRRALAEQSKRLLAIYRSDRAIDPAQCPLHRALQP